MTALLVLSLQSSPPYLRIPLFSWDKLQHAGAYAVLTAFAGITFLLYLKRTTAWALAFATAIIYGGLLEIAQGAFTHVRAPEWSDLAADAIGAGAVLFIVWLWRVVRARLKGQ